MIIVDRPDFQLDVDIRKVGNYHSLEIKQLHPQAQNPHWRRVCQLNLAEHELVLLIGRLAGEIE